MWKKFIIKTILIFAVVYTFSKVTFPSVFATQTVLAHHNISLKERYGNSYVNDVFKNNILLSLAYMSGQVHTKSDINWTEIDKPFRFDYILYPGEVFAFHDDVLAAYKNKPLKTTNAHFNSHEGFLSDGLLFGDGVCHLASLIKWAAMDAKMEVVTPTSHDFARIPQIPAEYGVSIYTAPLTPESNQRQNLYIENTLNKPVLFSFDYKEGVLNLEVSTVE